MPNPDPLLTVAHPHVHELEIRRSRFRCLVAEATDETTARGLVTDQRTAHPKANHHCVAYVLGSHREIQRSSDDGEPGGTAGVPMLDVLLRRGMTNTVAVVTRYFGGIRLGAGGLVRAYGQAVSQTLDLAGTAVLRPYLRCQLRADYADAGLLEHEIRQTSGDLRTVTYQDHAEFEVDVPETDLDSFRHWASRTAGGRVHLLIGHRHHRR
ncbi:YigZ family protein [Actinoalloteichus sp. AHMU CJ021]|uniref:Uncharacterized protein, YigZ family n=2 Tax=Actinoalloteichus cyanogriseus TaxID=2893586 RepID=A0ABT1JD98_ACTCY|nr:YigZ family protein [Actinoalloteichus caeruleus]AUS81002.1 YigZ family protein [Actinoalloteichus sp. AHMU CJ021]MCP2330471.1 uncharacterized protein, YigZ family [Actinoalloteichus caeruleus DSM 43889]